MATTRIIPMHINKGKTISQCITDRIDYALNPGKTDNGNLVDNITKCKDMFPEWLPWNYLKDIFIIPNCNKNNEAKAIKASKDETAKYMKNLSLYPFQCYIHWQPEDAGYLLTTDRKFLELLYRQHGDKMFDKDMVMDASEETKFAIYDFIDDNTVIDIIVDCENSDIYKLYSTLSNLDEGKLSKINKIILYDDYHTVGAWQLLEKIIKIPVEYVNVDRVTSGKSLVDIKMTAGACKEHYVNSVNAFIIVSSDSDFWGLISSLPDADFLVMIEYEKCGHDIKQALEEHNIFYCAIDDFCKGNVGHIKNLALKTELKRIIDEFNNSGFWAEMNSNSLVDNIYRTCRIEPTPNERKKFVDTYVAKMKLGIDANGNFYISLP